MRPAVNHVVMHEINRAVLLDMLRKQPSMTRAKLAKRTGLTRSAISNLTDELLRANMIREVGYEASSGGRRGIKLALNPDGGCVIALKLNASAVQCALLDLTGGIIWRELAPLESTDKPLVMFICQQFIDRALKANGDNRPALGIGVAAPGLISADGEMIYSRFMNWRNVRLRDEWQQRYGLPVNVDNLVSLAALGESRFGSAADDSHFFYIEIGYGAGAGIVINHQLYQGKNGIAGEVGYMQGFAGADRKKDWQELVNIPALLGATKRLIESGSRSSLDSADLSFDKVALALRDGDPAACWALGEMSRFLGIGIASLYNAFDIPVFIIGGELGQEYEICLEQARRAAMNSLIVEPPDGIELRISRMEPDAALMGAAARVFDTVLIEPSLPVGL